MVSMRAIKAAAREIAERFHPERIILFGSHARGTADEHSDVDLMILMKGKGRRVHDQDIRISLAIDFGFPVDLLVRSPQEFERRIGWGDYFLKEIQEKGIILYESADTGMDRKSRGRFRNGTARSPRESSQITIAPAFMRNNAWRNITRRDCRKLLSRHAVKARYPGSALGVAEAKDMLARCREIRSLVRQSLGVK
jgi:uncharacterized protein